MERILTKEEVGIGMENSCRKIWGLEDLVLGIIECLGDKRVVILVVRVIEKIGQRNIGLWKQLYWKIISLDIEV